MNIVSKKVMHKIEVVFFISLKNDKHLNASNTLKLLNCCKMSSYNDVNASDTVDVIVDNRN